MHTFIQKPWKIITSFLDRTNMYLVMLYGLLGIFLYAFLLSLLGVLSITPISLVGSLVVLLLGAGIASVVCDKLVHAHAHHQSSFITALILFFLLSPATTTIEYVVLAGVSVVAVVTKYICAYRNQHIFNAAAFAVFLVALTGFDAATWWVATPLLCIPVAVAGLLVVSKVRAWPMVLSFAVVGFLTFLFEEWRYGNDILATWKFYFLAYPTMFLGFFMLTEPFALPPTRTQRMGYGALVGFLSSTALFLPFFTITPELALLLGNLAAYSYTLRRKVYLPFVSKKEIGLLLYEFTFTKPHGLRYLPGQYLEWMLPQSTVDGRGIRRYFTILSSPTETVVRLACKVPRPGSTYKQALLALTKGDIVIASQLAGDFLLPKDPTKKIAWVAGGIGVTPFVSQAQFLKDTNDRRNIVLLYAANSEAELVYQNELRAVCTLVPILASGQTIDSESGYLTADIVTRRVADYRERTWFVSGPPGMVAATTTILTSLGVPKRQIVRDFFPGLA